MSILITLIQQNVGSSNSCNRAETENKRQADCKGRNKQLFLADNIIDWKNTKESTKKLLELISEFSKVSVYKINI